LFFTYRFGYHVKIKKWFFIEPSIAFTYWTTNTSVPESFREVESKWPIFFVLAGPPFWCQVLIHLRNAIFSMKKSRPIHPDFLSLLDFKDQEVIDLFTDLRNYILDLYPDSNELLYHTHALTAVFSVSDKLSDAFCMLPIYTGHLNLGFNKGSRLKDPHKLLTGTGNLIRHIDVMNPDDYRNPKVKALLKEAIDYSIKDMEKPTKSTGKTISKIKKK